MQWFRILLVTIALGLICASFAMAWLEYESAVTENNEATIYLSAIAGEVQFPHPMSLFGQTKQLSTCLDLLESDLGFALGRYSQERVAQACRDLALFTLNSAPNFALGHLVAAASEEKLGLVGSASHRLAHAKRLAPCEGWQAALRLKVAFNIGLQLVDETARSDARLVLKLSAYRYVLAELYQHNPAKRDWLRETLYGGNARDLDAFLQDARGQMGLAAEAT